MKWFYANARCYNKVYRCARFGWRRTRGHYWSFWAFLIGMFGEYWCWMACCIPIALSRMSRWVAVLPYIRLVCCLGRAVNVYLLASSFGGRGVYRCKNGVGTAVYGRGRWRSSFRSATVLQRRTLLHEVHCYMQSVRATNAWLVLSLWIDEQRPPDTKGSYECMEFADSWQGVVFKFGCWARC